MSFPRPFHRWRPHPWHGLEPGPDPPRLVNAYIEITPFDLIKYEVDKATGYLRVDRPQRTSSVPPTLYGFIPRTYCGVRVGDLSPSAARGDGDPLDICVISERPIARAEVLLVARVVGGLRILDEGEADDKIVAVLDNDEFWAGTAELADVPGVLMERITHYFKTYKLRRGAPNAITLDKLLGREEAFAVIAAALEDYRQEAGEGSSPAG